MYLIVSKMRREKRLKKEWRNGKARKKRTDKKDIKCNLMLRINALEPP